MNHLCGTAEWKRGVSSFRLPGTLLIFLLCCMVLSAFGKKDGLPENHVPPLWEIIPEHPDYPFYDMPVAAIQVTDDRLRSKLPTDPAQEDCTATFQEAIDAVASNGGGMVFIPEGEYLIRGNLIVRQGITLRGHWQTPKASGWKTGTVLKIVPRLSAEDDPACIEVQSGGIQGLNFYYPEQDPNKVRAYPPTIKAGGHVSLSDVTFVNSYWAVDATRGAAFALWQGIYGSPIHMGLYSGHGVALPRYMVIELSPKFWEWWPMDNATANAGRAGNYAHHMYNHGTGFVLLNHDGFNFNYGEIEGYNIGLQAGDVDDQGNQLEGDIRPNGEIKDVRVVNCQTAYRNITALIKFKNAQIGDAFYLHNGEKASSYKEVLEKKNEDPEASVGLDYRKDWNRSRKPAQARIFNIKDYGAIGDKETDDTKAVQAAITAANRNKGGIVFFPPGVYRLTAPISVGEGIELCGSAGSRVYDYQLKNNKQVTWATGIIYAEYKGDPEGPALLTLGSGSGIRTLGFFSHYQNMKWVLAGNELVEEPYLVRMSGRNNYAISPFASNPYQFLDIVNSDGFLVEHFLASATHNVFRVRNSKNGRIQFGHNKAGDWLGALADDNTLVTNREDYRRSMPRRGLTAIKLYDSDNINMAHIFNRCVRAAVRINNTTGTAITVKGEQGQSGYIFETGVPDRVYRIVGGHMNPAMFPDGTGLVGVELLETFDGVAEYFNTEATQYDYHFRVKSGHLKVKDYSQTVSKRDFIRIDVLGDGFLEIEDSDFTSFSLNVGPQARVSLKNVEVESFPVGNMQGRIDFENVTYKREFLYSVPRRHGLPEYGITLLPQGLQGAQLVKGNSFYYDINEPRFKGNELGESSVRVIFTMPDRITAEQFSVNAYYTAKKGEKKAKVSSRLRKNASGWNIYFSVPDIWVTPGGEPDFRIEFTSSEGISVIQPRMEEVAFFFDKQGRTPMAATRSPVSPRAASASIASTGSRIIAIKSKSGKSVEIKDARIVGNDVILIRAKDGKRFNIPLDALDAASVNRIKSHYANP